MPAMLDLRRTVAALVAVAMSAALIAFAFFVSDSFAAQMRSNAELSVGDADVVVNTGRRADGGKGLDDTLVFRLESLDGVESARGEHWDVIQLDLPAGDTAVVTRDVPTLNGHTLLTAGRLPDAVNEVAISTRLAQTQSLGVGDTVRLKNDYDGDVHTSPTVVGIVSPGAEAGALDEGTQGTVYAVPEQLAAMGADTSYYNIYVTAQVGADASAVLDEVRQAAQSFRSGVVVLGADEAIAQRAASSTVGGTLITTILNLLAPMCAVVAAIVIATTFTTLIARQTRTIGLLRCIGASRPQVTRSVLRTAALTGLTGSCLGAVIGVGAAAGIIRSGIISGLSTDQLTITPRGLVATILLGTLVTIIAVLRPARRASRVSPLIAVTGLTVTPQRYGHGRAWAAAGGGLLVVGGAAVLIFGASTQSFYVMVGGAVLIALGILLALPFLAGVLVTLVERIGSDSRYPTLHLAARNLSRNRGRSTATTATLFLCMLVGSAVLVAFFSVNDSYQRIQAENSPIDITIFGVEPDTDREALTTTVEAVDGVEDTVFVPGMNVDVTVGGQTQSIDISFFEPAEVAGVSRSTSNMADLEDDVLVVNDYQGIPDGAQVTLTGPAGSVELTARHNNAWWTPAITPATAERLNGGASTEAVMWVRTTGDGSSKTIEDAVSQAIRGQNLMAQGSSENRDEFTALLQRTELTIGLVMVAALVICLSGMANTTDVSVLERIREIGLLRATGSDRSGIRQLIVTEAVLLALIGGVLGILAGALVGAVGSLAAMGNVGLRVSLPWLPLLGLLAITTLIGIGASLRPAGRAAAIPPVIALAQE
ncbi:MULTISPECIES: FtsX-like permease family protein [unclassified Actinomyces]|uniref:FtsX-like permease family protein n=1 Tax=unclassified Actinomyces TaxID=2609248 RepID=UPI000D59E82C|nr:MULTISPECIES: ABC transporter permease [unclassified Actinomyces]RAX21332.1 ABC transporter permease [Actinomyces sp. Z5]RAX22641.1 ABC transporter permease [Actinomyces sp. Z3]